MRPSTTYFHPFFGLVVGSNPARGLEINADGHIIPEYQPGRYRDTIKGYSASPGKRIKVVIKTPKTHTITPYKIPQIKNPILAKTVVGAMARFITPTHNGILNPTGIPPKVTFSWTSGKAPYDIYIYEQKSPTQLGKRVFEKKGIFKTTITIAAATFVPDKKYRIFLIYKMGNFSFTGDFARGSSLQLRYSNAVSFSVKNRI